MSSILTLDLETASVDKARIEEFKKRFEPKPPEPEPEPEEEEKPKKRKKATKKEEKPKKLKSDRAGLHFLTGRVVCVGTKFVGRAPQMFADENEEIILAGVHDYIYDHPSFTLVTFNGRDFDLPMLYMRGLLHGFDFAQLLPMEKYSKSHIDLYQHLGGRWGMNGTLAELAWHFGLADGLDGHGSSIQQQFDNGDWESIIAHCRADVEVTEGLYLKLFPNGRKKRY
jgi:DNA polymerase elongation subunit (family B)